MSSTGHRPPANDPRPSWDVIIVGGGLIGLALALALRKQGATVLIVDRAEPGREASHAAAGMLAHCDPHTPPLLQPLALASAKLYPEFIHEIEDESGERVDFRQDGTLMLVPEQAAGTPVSSAGTLELSIPCAHTKTLDADELAVLEPGLRRGDWRAIYLPEAVVDPRQLTAAALAAARHRGVDVSSGNAVTEVIVVHDHAAGVRAERTQFAAKTVVNCAGAWSGQIAPRPFPTRPVKGQMLALVAPITYDAHGSPSSPHMLRHVVRAPDVYLAPRSDGRIIIGSTLEEAGFDKRVDPATIRRLYEAAIGHLPALATARMLESWAGLRPATPDHLPILGETVIAGYFVATGHYRDGILLAPITAHLMAHVIRGLRPELDISAFTPARF